MGIFLALVSGILYAFSMLLSKFSVDKTKSPVAVSVVFQVLAGISLVPILFFEKPQILNSEPQVFWLFVLSNVMYGIFSILGIRASKRLQVSINTVIGQVFLIIVFFASLVIFKENATIQKLLGVVLILLGNVFLVGALHKGKTLDYTGVFLKLGASVALAVAFLTDAVNSANFSPVFYACIIYFTNGITTWAMDRTNPKELLSELKTNWKMQLIMAIVASVGYVFLLKAFALEQKSIVTPINNLNGVFLFILGMIFLKEHDHFKRKVLATVLAFAGAILLSI